MKTICIAGKNDIAVDILEYCLNNLDKTRIVCIVNRNEVGKNNWQKSLGWYAKKHAVEIVSIQDVYEIEDLLFLSTEFDQIIRPEKFKSTELFNIHFSMLPKYKGCFPSVLPILNGEDSTGVTLHKMREGIDTGEIIAQRKVNIEDEDTSYDLYLKLISEGTKLVEENIDDLLTGRYNCRPQEKRGSTYYSINEIDYSTLSLDVNKTAWQICNQVKAFAFRPYQLLEWNNIGLIGAEISDEVSIEKPGIVLEEDDISIKLATIDYNVILFKDVLTELFESIKSGDNNTAKHLCGCSSIINAKDKHGWSPLIVAVYNGNIEMAKYLVDNGADIHVKNNNGTNLLMYAKNNAVDTGDLRILEYVLSLGLDLLEQDYEGFSVIDYVRNEDVPVKVRELLEI